VALPQGLLVENGKFVTGLAPINPSTSTPDCVSMKNYDRCTVILIADNGTATGGAVTLEQATVVAATDAKALAFSWVWANIDTDATDTLVKTAVTSNTFTTDSTNTKNLLYVMEINAEDLDQANGFDCVRATMADTTAQVVCILYYLWNSRYAKATPPSAILD